MLQKNSEGRILDAVTHLDSGDAPDSGAGIADCAADPDRNLFIFCGTETDRYGGCSGISCVLDVMPCSVWSSDSWTGTVISVIVDDWSVCVRGSTG